LIQRLIPTTRLQQTQQYKKSLVAKYVYLMAKQPEQILEEQLVAQLQRLGYGLVQYQRRKDLIANLKTAIRKTQQHSIQQSRI
jgi:hypothetical protein